MQGGKEGCFKMIVHMAKLILLSPAVHWCLNTQDTDGSTWKTLQVSMTSFHSQPVAVGIADRRQEWTLL